MRLVVTLFERRVSQEEVVTNRHKDHQCLDERQLCRDAAPAAGGECQTKWQQKHSSAHEQSDDQKSIPSSIRHCRWTGKRRFSGGMSALVDRVGGGVECWSTNRHITSETIAARP